VHTYHLRVDAPTTKHTELTKRLTNLIVFSPAWMHEAVPWSWGSWLVCVCSIHGRGTRRIVAAAPDSFSAVDTVSVRALADASSFAASALSQPCSSTLAVEPSPQARTRSLPPVQLQQAHHLSGWSRAHQHCFRVAVAGQTTSVPP
jgi:hypothetical protein